MKTKRILALTLSATMILGITACADTAQETAPETSVETTEIIETTVEETEAIEETVVETEETVEETEVEVVREEIPYSIDGLSAQEIFDTIVAQFFLSKYLKIILTLLLVVSVLGSSHIHLPRVRS